MESYEGCVWEKQEDGSILLRNICVPEGEICLLLLGEGGAFALLPEEADEEALRLSMRDLLGITRIDLHSFPEAALNDTWWSEVEQWIHQTPPVCSSMALERMRARLVETDARCRGYYRDREGTLYLLRHGNFRKASELDADHLFRLCLFGGVFGLHRFAMGKWATGLFYALTGGFCLAGWLVDLLSFLLGVQKDKEGALLAPQTNWRVILRLLPLGLLSSILCFFLYIQSLKLISGTFSFVFFEGVQSHSSTLSHFLDSFAP